MIEQKKFVKYINNNDYDVISVQETFDYEIKDLITKKCHENGYSHIISRAGQPACRGIFYESGLMIISKLPILNAETIQYNQASGSDVMTNKGFLVADIDFNGQIITVVNTHLQSGNDMVSLEKRINQFEQLKNAIKQKKNGKMIVTGDFNADMNDSAEKDVFIDFVKELGLIDSFKLLNPGVPGFTFDSETNPHVFASEPERFRIDYIFVSQTLNKQITESKLDKVFVDNIPLSDHYGVEIIMSL